MASILGTNSRLSIPIAGPIRKKATRSTLGLIACATVILADPGASCAQDQKGPPNDIDLKAAYCIEATQSGLDYVNDQIAQAQATKEDANVIKIFKETRDASVEQLNHLKRYLLPRLKFLDATGLRFAAEQAKSDRTAWGKVYGQCGTNCPLDSNHSACMKACDPALWARTDQCGDLAWLPF